MTHLRQHDADATLQPEPSWRDRIQSLDEAFRWAGIIGVQVVVAMLSGEEEKASRLTRIAHGFAMEGFGLSSVGW